MDKISVTQMLSKREFLTFGMKRFFRNILLISLYPLLFLFAYILFNLWMKGEIGIEALLFVVGIMLLIPAQALLRLMDTYRTDASLKMLSTYHFSDTGIRLESDKLRYEKSWDLIYQVKETRDHFLLFNNKNDAIILKKESFEDMEDIEVLTSLVKEKSHIKQMLLT